MSEFEIKKAEVQKTFNTIGEVRYRVVFLAYKGSTVWVSVAKEYKSEKTAQKKLADWKAKFQK